MIERERRCIFSIYNSYGVFCLWQTNRNEHSPLAYVAHTHSHTHQYTLALTHAHKKWSDWFASYTLLWFFCGNSTQTGWNNRNHPAYTHTTMNTACRTIVRVCRCVCGMRCAWSASRVKEETKAKRPSTIHRTCFV